MKHRYLVPKVTCFPNQTNYTYGVASMKSLSYNSFSNCHDERLTEKIFQSLHIEVMFKTTLRACNIYLFVEFW